MNKSNPSLVRTSNWLTVTLAFAWLANSASADIHQEFVFETAPFPSCHASTLAETPTGLIAAWFGGTREGASDVGIWISREQAGAWSAPLQVAKGAADDGKPLPCWNPVLFQPPRGDLLLFYKVGPSPGTWWGMRITSADGGKTWSPPRRLPEGILGPIKDKPVLLVDSTLLCGSSTESASGWQLHMERTSDWGLTWSKTEALNDGKTIGAIQPTILVHSDPRSLQLLCRTRQGTIHESWSTDAGLTWTPLKPTTLPNPNSGIDAVQLRDGRSLVVYNHTPRGRSPLNVAISKDGHSWQPGPLLESEPGEYSYPAVIQTSDGKIHITYTWKRQRIRHAILDPAEL